MPRGRIGRGASHQTPVTNYRDGLDGLIGLPAPVVEAGFGLHLSLPVLRASQAARVAKVQV
jgi:hypothetical protein